MKIGTLVVLLFALPATVLATACENASTPSDLPADTAGEPKDAAPPHDAAPDTGPAPVDAGPVDAGTDGGEVDSGGDSAWDAAGLDMGVIPNCGPSPTGRGGDMCAVPAGPYMMGCNEAVDNECTDEEKPYHEVTVPAFYIDKFEVTAGEYRRCVTEGGCVPPRPYKYCNYAIPGRENHPINCIHGSTHGEATREMAYCKWVGKRLPSEAEWEKAARGTDARKYPWGNDPLDCDRAVMSVAPCSNTETAPVGTKPAGVSPYGAFDLIGNLWEFVEDGWHEDYEGAPTDGSVWPRNPNALNVTIRGGQWKNTESFRLRASARAPDAWDDEYLSFRCAASPNEICLPDCAGKCGGEDKCGGTCPNQCVPPEFCGGAGTLNVCGVVTPNCGPSPTGMGGDMCDIPAGPFMMGRNKLLDDGGGNDTPTHLVTVPAFKIDKTDVTVSEYSACVAASACTPAGSTNWCNYGGSEKENHPINCVDCEQARTYCAWAGKRLPSDSEWEKAARGTDGRLYPWGNDSVDCQHTVICENFSNYPENCGCGSGGTAPVGSKPLGSSPYGVLDMTGNVMQWIEDDWHYDYDMDGDGYQPDGDGGKDAPSDGSPWIDSPRDHERVVRGGAWISPLDRVFNATDREGVDVTSNRPSEVSGFRCAWDGR